MALIDRVREVNRRLPNKTYYRLFVNDVAVGFVDEQVIAWLTADLFTVSHLKQRVDIRFSAANRESFTVRLDGFLRQLFFEQGLTGWRDELYSVSESYGSETFFVIERAALALLGITGHGVHINGYVKQGDDYWMWIAKRAKNKPTAPGKLDQIAAGGLPYNVGVKDNVIKECQEEASIPKALASQAKPVSAISYCYDLSLGMRPDVIFNYDLALPEDFVPQVNDGEVEAFSLMPIDSVLECLADSQDFKFNSGVVVIDFALRHGLISPEHSDYLALQEGMNQRWKRFL